MGTHNTCIRGDIRKIQTFFVENLLLIWSYDVIAVSKK